VSACASRVRCAKGFGARVWIRVDQPRTSVERRVAASNVLPLLRETDEVASRIAAEACFCAQSHMIKNIPPRAWTLAFLRVFGAYAHPPRELALCSSQI
jgi:hypothetical protein